MLPSCWNTASPFLSTQALLLILIFHRPNLKKGAHYVTLKICGCTLQHSLLHTHTQDRIHLEIDNTPLYDLKKKRHVQPVAAHNT